MASHHGWNVGSKVLAVASFDGTQHPAEVLDKKSSHGRVQYYVHYLDCDKRLDEWLPSDRLAPGQGGAAPRLESLPSAALGAGEGGDPKLTRRLKRKFEDLHHVPSGHLGEGHAEAHHGPEAEHHERTKVKNVEVVEFGRHEMDTWYWAPYPAPYGACKKLYICEYTLKYFRKKSTLLRHTAKLSRFHPPGDEIYRSPSPGGGADSTTVSGAVTNPPIAVFEVDGRKNKVYCQNLCLLSKLFLDHKTLYYDVDPFLFYVLCEKDAQGYHIVGYFSKEKNSVEGNNLACILTLPAYQRKGYGRFLIAFSYELSKKEGKVGSPERPLSDLGAVSYRSYWTRMILEALRDSKASLSIKDISEATAIKTEDVVRTLESLSLIKYWKGDHIISVTQKIIEEHLRAIAYQKTIEIDISRLHWTPYPTAPAGKK